MLVAFLMDGYVDRLFAADDQADDILEFRAAMGRQAPALGQVMALCAGRARLTTEAIAVPITDYPRLAVEDFMVSLYNDHSVQRLRLVEADGRSFDMLETLAAAIAEVGKTAELPQP